MDDYEKMRAFVRQEFKKNYCSRFVPKERDGVLCHCGAGKEAHSPGATIASGDETPWSAETDIREDSTDAFGEISFHNGNNAKYIRVGKQTDAAILLVLMNSYWKLKNPKLLISVTGGALNFVLNPGLKQVFRNGLIAAASSTDAWIVTGGTHAGVMRHVGEAVRDYTLKHGSKKPIVNIGIATWGCVNNNKLLVNEKGSWPAHYTASEEKEMEKGESALDMNHTHFIFVDDGTRLQFGVEIGLRSLLEKNIALKKTSENSSVSIPRVVVVLEGGPNTLETVSSSMKSGAPVIVVEGSGRVADLLAFAYNNSEPLEVQAKDASGIMHTKVVSFYGEDFHKKLENEIKKIFPKSTPADVDRTEQKIISCVDNRDFLSIFKLHGSPSSDIDIVILQALIKTKKISKIDQLRLALDWNRADTAGSEIYTEEEKFQVKDIEDLMYKALLENKTKFVELFLSRDFSLRRFLYQTDFNNPEKVFNHKVGSSPTSSDRLMRLYSDRVTKQRCLLLQHKLSSVKRVGDMVTLLTGDYYEHRYRRTDSPLFVDPANDLFLWAVFVRYREMAMLFWEHSKHTTAAAITAQHITKSMRDKNPESEFSDAMEEDALFYGKVAVGLLGECYDSDSKRSSQLLTQKLPAYDGADALKMAVMAENKEFVAHPAAQNLLTGIWMGRLSENNYLLLIVTSLIIPFLAPLLLRFNNKDEQIENEIEDAENNLSDRYNSLDNKKKKLSYRKYFNHLDGFFSAPFTAFCYNCASYFALILLFGVILLTDFYPVRLDVVPAISVKEIILIIWVFSLSLEEIRQALSNEAKTLQGKLINYSKDFWNILDIMILLLYACGLILRFIPISINPNFFYAARIILSFCLLAFFMRILHMFSVHRELGPKLVMIGKMMIDLFYFMLILMVFIAAYGISTQIIMYPNQPLNIALARDVLSSAWWDIYGSFNLEEVSGIQCAQNNSKLDASFCAATFSKADDWAQCLGKEEKCPAIDWLVPIMLALYALVVNIMMLNILIAIFSNTFNNVQNQTNLVWKMQRYSLVREFETKPTLPPPLNLLGLFYKLILYFSRSCNNTIFPEITKSKKERMAMLSVDLSNWESIYAKEYLRKQTFDDGITNISNTTEDFDDKNDLEILSNRLDYIEKQMDQTLSAIEWVVHKLSGKSGEDYHFVSPDQQIEIDEKILSDRKNMKKEKSTDCDSALIPLLCVHG